MSSITVAARLEFQKIAFGNKKDAHLLITLEGEKYNGARKPLSVVAVVDVSGSMQGQKIDYARRSLKKLVEHLTDQDTLAILCFSTDVFTAFETSRMTAEAKTKAISEVEKLHTIADTNLSGATLGGYNALREAKEKKMVGSIDRAFIFTDRQPTAGVQDLPSLVKIAGQRPEDASLSCFGFGADYNKELMTAMTKAGGGNEYHITTPDEAPKAFGREIGGLLSCVAQAVKVTIKTKPDVKIKEVLNDFDVKGNAEETEAVITVDDVYSNEKRKLLLRLELPAMHKSGHAFKLGDVKVEFQDLLVNEMRSEEVAVKVEYVKDADADKESDKDVMEQIAVQKAAKAQEEAILLAQQGNYVGANRVVQDAALFCSSLGTAFASSVAGDLNQQVAPWLNAQKFQKGGAHYLRSNVRSYSTGRAQTSGTADLYNTEHQTAMEASFSKPDDAPGADPSLTINSGSVAPGFPPIVPSIFPHNPVLPPVVPQYGPLHFQPPGGNKIPPVKIHKHNPPMLSKKRTRR